MTKADIRAHHPRGPCTPAGDLLWDVGAGAGSIGLEWMLRHPGQPGHRHRGQPRPRAVSPATPATRCARHGGRASAEAPEPCTTASAGCGLHRRRGIEDGVFEAVGCTEIGRSAGRQCGDARSRAGDPGWRGARRPLSASPSSISNRSERMHGWRAAMPVTQWRGDEAMIVAGIGLRAGLRGQDIVALFYARAEDACAAADDIAVSPPSPVVRREAGFIEAAATHLNLPRSPSSRCSPRLARPPAPTRRGSPFMASAPLRRRAPCGAGPVAPAPARRIARGAPAPARGAHVMTIHFIGAGPGRRSRHHSRPDLIARRTVCLYAGSSFPPRCWPGVHRACVLSTPPPSISTDRRRIGKRCDGTGCGQASIGRSVIWSAVGEQLRRLVPSEFAQTLTPGFRPSPPRPRPRA